MLLFFEPLSIQAQLNDARPAGSPPLLWSYQVALRVEVVSTCDHPLSVHNAANAFAIFPPDNFGTIDVPVGADSLVYYTGRMPFEGLLVGVDWHAHQVYFQSALIVAAAPSNLGLASTAFRPRRTYDPIITAETGFPNNNALRQHMLHFLATGKPD
jgi:hypothetical protein